MSRLAIPVGSAALLLFCACGGTAGATLRVRPPPPGEGGADAQRSRVEDAVRDVAAIGNLRCEPPKEPGGKLLECWPADLAASSPLVSMHLRPAEAGYAVDVLESFPAFSRPRLLCPIQDRLVERIEQRLSGAAVERDGRLTCRKGAP